MWGGWCSRKLLREELQEVRDVEGGNGTSFDERNGGVELLNVRAGQLYAANGLAPRALLREFSDRGDIVQLVLSHRHWVGKVTGNGGLAAPP